MPDTIGQPTGVTKEYETTLLPNIRKMFPVYDKYTDKQILDGMRKKYNAYFDIPDDKLAIGIEKKYQPIIDEINAQPDEGIEEERKWYNKPITSIPDWIGMRQPRDATNEDVEKFFGKGEMEKLNDNTRRAIYGGFYGALESLDEMTTPLNLGLMGVTAGVYPLVKKGYHIARLGGSLASFIFAAQMGKELPKGWEHFADLVREAKDDPVKWGEVGQVGAQLILGTGMTVLGAKHGIGELRGEIRTMKTLKKLDLKPTTKITGKEIEGLIVQRTSDEIKMGIEYERFVGRSEEFNYNNVNEVQQRVRGLQELNKTKADLDKFGSKKTGIDQGEGFWEKEYTPGRQRKIVTDKDKDAKSEPYQEELFRPPGLKGQQELFSPGEKMQPPTTNKLPTDPTLPLNQLPYQTELFRPYEILGDTPLKLSKAQVEHRNSILIEAGKRGLVDKFGSSSFEMIRLLDMFGVDSINKLSVSQMNRLNKMIKNLPTDYAGMQVKLGDYYNKINKSVFSRDIAREIVSGKDLTKVKIPYDDNYDYVYNPRTAAFEKEKINIASPDDYKYILKQSRSKFGEDSNRILNELTDGQLKRMNADDLKLLRNRLDKANPKYTPEELKSYLSNGADVFSFSERYAGDRFDWLLSATAQSAFRFFEKVGMGQVFNDAVKNKRLADITTTNLYNNTIEAAFKPIKNNKLKMREFSELALRYRTEGMAAFARNPEYIPIMEKIKGAMKEIADLSVEHGVEVYNPITGKNELFSNHIDPNYQPNMYHPKKVAAMRKDKALYEKIKARTGLTDHRDINAIVNNILHNRKGYRQGNLENVRLADEPGWLGDPRDPGWKPNDIIEGYKVYAHGAVDRITSLKFFEGRGTGGVDLYGKYINKMSDMNQKIAMEYMNKIRGMDKTGHFDDWASMIRNVQLMRKLNLSPIANAFQTTITSIPKYSSLGYHRLLMDAGKEFWNGIKSMKHNDLAALGIDIQHSMESLTGLQGYNNLNGIARKWLKANMFSTTEFFNRSFSYHLGTKYAERMIKMLHGRDRGLFNMEAKRWQTTNGRKQLIDELRKMGVSDKAIDTAVLTPNDLHRAGYRFSMETQFGTMPENLPFAWSSPWGKVATQFKSFTFSMARLTKDAFIKPILKNPSNPNSWKPLLTFAVTSQMTGEATKFIRQQALNHIFGIERKKPSPDDPIIRGIENMVAISPFGLGFELWQSLGYGDFWGSVLGPTGGDIEDMAIAIRKGELPIEKVMPYPLDQVIKQQMRE